MNFKNLTLILCLNIVTQSLIAQVSATEIVKEWERSKTYTMAYLEAMPESNYGLKPAPGMRSFAGQFLHLADANYGLASAALNIKSPYIVGELEKTNDTSKANVTRLVAASYDFIIEHIKKLTEGELQDTIKMIGRFEMSKANAIAKVFEHQAHHRGQTTVYIRLAGVKPPQEQLF